MVSACRAAFALIDFNMGNGLEIAARKISFAACDRDRDIAWNHNRHPVHRKIIDNTDAKRIWVYVGNNNAVFLMDAAFDNASLDCGAFCHGIVRIDCLRSSICR